MLDAHRVTQQRVAVGLRYRAISAGGHRRAQRSGDIDGRVRLPQLQCIRPYQRVRAVLPHNLARERRQERRFLFFRFRAKVEARGQRRLGRRRGRWGAWLIGAAPIDRRRYADQREQRHHGRHIAKAIPERPQAGAQRVCGRPHGLREAAHLFAYIFHPTSLPAPSIAAKGGSIQRGCFCAQKLYHFAHFIKLSFCRAH